MKKLYHITTSERVKSILSDGLIANYGESVNSGVSEEGYIYLFENKSYIHPLFGNAVYVADDIAMNQLFINGKYVMLEIDTDGINGELEHDDVAEFASFAQWKVKQDKIDKQYINVFGVYNPNDEVN